MRKPYSAISRVDGLFWKTRAEVRLLMRLQVGARTLLRIGIQTICVTFSVGEKKSSHSVHVWKILMMLSLKIRD